MEVVEAGSEFGCVLSTMEEATRVLEVTDITASRVTFEEGARLS